MPAEVMERINGCLGPREVAQAKPVTYRDTLHEDRDQTLPDPLGPGTLDLGRDSDAVGVGTVVEELGGIPGKAGESWAQGMLIEEDGISV
ncbi:MAG: hypothetical protein ACYCZM_14010 [Acidimicrobiales bacterium]